VALKAVTSPARRGLAAIASGAALGQVVLVAGAPILSRLYDPTAFGVFSVVNAVVLAVGTVAAFRFEMAVPLPKSDGEAHALVRLGSVAALAVAVLGTVLVLVSRGSLASLTGWSDDVVDLLIWAPLGAAMLGMYLVLNQLAVRRRAYSAIALRNVLQAVATVGAQVGLGLAGWGAVGLVIGLIAGQAAGVASLAWSLRNDLTSHDADSPALRALVRRYRSFPLVLAPSGLINSLGMQAPLLAVTSLYGTASAGSLGMAQRVLAIPLALIGMAISQVLMGELAARKRDGRTDLMPVFMSVTKRLTLVGVAGGVGVLVVGPLLFATFLGQQWWTSGHMARAMAVGLLVQIIAAPLSQLAIIAGKNVAQLLWDIGRLLACVLAVFVASWVGLSDVGAVWCLGVATAASYAVSWVISRWAVRIMTVQAAAVQRP